MGTDIQHQASPLTENQESSRQKKKSKNTKGRTRPQLPWVLPLRRPRFYLPRLTMSIPTLPAWLITVGIMLSIFYIFSGGVYNRVEDFVPAYLSDGETVRLVYNDGNPDTCESNRQYVLEGLFAGMMMFLGSIGLYVNYLAAKDPHNPDRASNFQIIGTIFIILAFLLVQNMMQIKGCV